jgi:hypothetical protein
MQSGLETASNRQNGAFQLGRHTAGDVMRCMAEVEQPVGAKFEITQPPLVNPAARPMQRATNLRDGLSRQAQLNGAVAIGKLVVHGDLQ